MLYSLPQCMLRTTTSAPAAFAFFASARMPSALTTGNCQYLSQGHSGGTTVFEASAFAVVYEYASCATLTPSTSYITALWPVLGVGVGPWFFRPAASSDFFVSPTPWMPRSTTWLPTRSQPSNPARFNDPATSCGTLKLSVAGMERFVFVVDSGVSMWQIARSSALIGLVTLANIGSKS